VDDDRGLLDSRQPLFDPVGDRRAGGADELMNVLAGRVPGGEREDEPRLVRRIAEGPEELVTYGAPGRVDGRPDEHHRADPFRPPRRQLSDDLTTHRVGDERRPVETDDIEPVTEGLRESADGGGRRRSLTLPVAGKIGHVRGTVGGKVPGQREQVSARDAVSVDEHDGRPVPSGAGVNSDSGRLVPAALQRDRSGGLP
jgi:hypothetical protein